VRGRLTRWETPLAHYKVSYAIYGDFHDKTVTINMSGEYDASRQHARDQLKQKTGNEPSEAEIRAEAMRFIGIELGQDTILSRAPRGEPVNRRHFGQGLQDCGELPRCRCVPILLSTKRVESTVSDDRRIFLVELFNPLRILIEGLRMAQSIIAGFVMSLLLLVLGFFTLRPAGLSDMRVFVGLVGALSRRPEHRVQSRSIA